MVTNQETTVTKIYKEDLKKVLNMRARLKKERGGSWSNAQTLNLMLNDNPKRKVKHAHQN